MTCHAADIRRRNDMGCDGPATVFSVGSADNRWPNRTAPCDAWRIGRNTRPALHHVRALQQPLAILERRPQIRECREQFRRNLRIRAFRRHAEYVESSTSTRRASRNASSAAGCHAA